MSSKILPGSYMPDLSMFRDILAIGIPSGLQGVARNAAQLFVMRIVTSTAAGTYGAAALAIGLQVESFAFMPGIALSVAATSLVGQSLGAWQLGDARLRGNLALLLGALVMSGMAVPLFIFAPQLVVLFEPSAHPTVVSAGASYIRINALFQPVLAVAMVVNGALRGAGDTRPGLVGTIIGRWLVVVPLAYVLAIVLGFGVQGVWWSLVVGTSVQALYVFVRWRSRMWVDVALHKTKLYRDVLQPLPEAVQWRYLNEVRAPLMASPDATEHVGEGGVRYDLEHKKPSTSTFQTMTLKCGTKRSAKLRLAREVIPKPPSLLLTIEAHLYAYILADGCTPVRFSQRFSANTQRLKANRFRRELHSSCRKVTTNLR